MRAREYWRAVTVDRSELLDDFLALLRQQNVHFCVIGGQGVNAYAEPVVSLDLDIVVAISDLGSIEAVLAKRFVVENFAHSINISQPGSDLRVQIQTDPRYAPFVERAEERDILGIRLPVARIDDVLQGKVWAVSDSQRRASKRQKDLADIARLTEARPELKSHVPTEILDRLF